MSDEGYSYDDNEDYGATRGNPYAVRSPNAGAIPADKVAADAALMTSNYAKDLAANTALAERFNTPGQQYDPLAASKAYDAAAQRIRARSTGPSRSEQLFAISAALAQPTKYSGFGAMFSNLSPVLQELQEKQRAADYGQQNTAEELALKGIVSKNEAYNEALKNRQTILSNMARHVTNEMRNAKPQLSSDEKLIYDRYPGNDPTSVALRNKLLDALLLKKSHIAPPKAAKPAVTFDTPHASKRWQ